MRVNIYAEEMTQRVEIVEKNGFTGLRVYLELPVSYHITRNGAVMPAQTTDDVQAQQLKGPFMHHPNDDDSSAITFWGKGDLHHLLSIMRDKLDEHYAATQRRNAIAGSAPNYGSSGSQSIDASNQQNKQGDYAHEQLLRQWSPNKF